MREDGYKDTVRDQVHPSRSGPFRWVRIRGQSGPFRLMTDCPHLIPAVTSGYDTIWADSDAKHAG